MSFNTFIINPTAGSGSTRRQLKALTNEIHALDRNARIMLTHHALHAMSLTRETLKSGGTRIIAIGGDGTLNEVINGFFNKDGNAINANASIAIVPSGTGSDFIRGIGRKQALKEAVTFALFGEAKPTDVGVVEAQDANGLKVKRFFLNVSSMGLSGLVAGNMKTVTRKFGAKVAYFLSTLQAIRTLKAPTILLTAPDLNLTLENCSLISLANGQYFGSGMKIAPDAKLDDGKLDLITIQDLGAMFFLRHGFRVYNGTHPILSNVHTYKLDDVLVQSLSKEPVYVEVDGELFAELPARYSVRKHAVNIVR